MFIYVNGDSNAAGFELSHMILPSYPGNIPPGIVTKSNFLSLNHLYAKASKWLESEVFIKEKADVGNNYIRELDKSKAWPEKLRQKLNCKMQVNAIPGASVVRVALTVQQDLIRLQKKNTIPDIVIIQLTDWIRTGTFDLTDSDLCTNINLSPNIESLRKNFAKAWYDIESEQDMIFRYLHHWLMIKHTVRAITGKDPLFVDSVYELHIADLLHKAKDPLQLELIKELGWDNFDKSLSMSYYYCDNTDYLHPGLHLPEPVHEKFANALAEKIINYVQ